MSHELRTPLNAILGFSEVMKTEVFGTHAVSAYKEYSSDIHNSGVHLLGLINEILDLSRIEARRYELKEESVSLVSIVEDCHHLLKLRASNRGITIHEMFELALPRLWADERAIRQICLNLLSNAIKFTPPGGDIWLKGGWTASGGQYISVKDTGDGIFEEEIP
jgi:two-component system, cell cycle sensor histidine kinase PleC